MTKPPSGQLEAYHKKLLPFRIGKHHLQVAVSQELFSSHDVDKGTRLLIRSLLKREKQSWPRVLDVGCGYGPLGLAMKADDATRIVHMTDRDALAVLFAADNVARNGFGDMETYGSLVYDDVRTEPFDLVVSNVPGKGSETLYRQWLLGAAGHLADGGTVGVVVVSALASLLSSILDETPDASVTFREDYSSHTVFHYTFDDPRAAAERMSVGDAFASGAFDRSVEEFSVRGLRYGLRTVHGLAEFDSPTFSTGLVIALLRETPGTIDRVVSFNPGQGHVPVSAWKRFEAGSIVIVDRDLLALRTSRANLLLNGCPDEHVTLRHALACGEDACQEIDLVVDHLRQKEPPQAAAARLRAAAAGMKRGGRMVVAGTSTAVTRAATALASEPSLVAADRRRRMGHSAALFVRR